MCQTVWMEHNTSLVGGRSWREDNCCSGNQSAGSDLCTEWCAVVWLARLFSCRISSMATPCTTNTWPMWIYTFSWEIKIVRGGEGVILYVGRYSVYCTTRCYTASLLFMAVRISKLVLQQAEKGSVSTVQHIGGFPQSGQRNTSNYKGCSLSTVHDIMNIKRESLQSYV